MEPHSWIIAIAGMAYLYFLCHTFDLKKVYLIKKSRIVQPSDTDKEGILLWQKEVEEFQKEIKAFRVKSVVTYSIIPFIELLLHAYFGDHLAQIWFISFIVCLFFLAGLLVLIYDMRQHDKFDEKKYKSPTSLLYN